MRSNRWSHSTGLWPAVTKKEGSGPSAQCAPVMGPRILCMGVGKYEGQFFMYYGPQEPLFDLSEIYGWSSPGFNLLGIRTPPASLGINSNVEEGLTLL